jgi:hypothetical protein
LNCRRKKDSKLLADSGFLCDNAPIIAVMLKDKIKKTRVHIPHIEANVWYSVVTNIMQRSAINCSGKYACTGISVSTFAA